MASNANGAGDEPMAEITVGHSTLRGSVAGGELIVRMIDEVPAVCALAAVSTGTTEIRDAAELRVQRLVDGAGGGAPRVMDLRPEDGDEI